MSKEKISLLALKKSRDLHDERAGSALVSAISVAHSASCRDEMERVESILDFLLGEAKTISDATLERHGIKRDASGKIEWSEK